MTRKLKALGISLLAVCALGAVAAQGATAWEHEFISEAPAVFTGENVTPAEKFAVGTTGTVECTIATLKSTQASSTADTFTATPMYAGCSFAGAAATVSFNHCALVFDSDTTSGNPDGSEHANVDIECAEGSRVEIDTNFCTITIAPQTIKHAVRYENEWIFGNSFIIKTTAKKIVTGKAKTTESQTGCLLFPTGAIGTYTGESTVECFEDEAWNPLSGTERTTPAGLTGEGGAEECEVA